MSVLRIKTAEVFEPLLQPARDKAAYGGRGSGKSHFFAGKLVEDSITEPGDSGEGLLSVCIREVQKDLAQSSKRLIETKLREHGLGEADGFKVFKDVIQTPGDGIIIFKGMNDYTADSIKSLEGFKRGWWEEAHGATETSIGLYRPTLRADGAERWWSWNPRFKRDPVDVMFRGEERPTGAVVVEASWRDNPWFTEELEVERQDTLRLKPEGYENVWEGGYVKVLDGAYFAKELAATKAENRITFVARDPNLQVRTFWDLGRRDHTAIWVAQFQGQKINVIDYIEGSGQGPGFYFEELRKRGYRGCMVVLPHDGSRVGPENSSGRSYEDQARDAGFDVQVVLNQGAGAAMLRVDAARRLFPRIWFNEATTEDGREVLGAYHERKDDKRGIGLGPEHDWASHGCFHGDTEILTRYGMCQIKELPKQGEVLTPCGWRPYIAPRITRRAAPLVEVVFSDGHSVKCTPDHLFLTMESGWKSAASLTPNIAIQSSLTNSRSISTAASTEFGRVIAIQAGAARSFIGMCGRRLSARSLTVVTSTIETVTDLTIGWRTWSALRPASISPLLGQSTAREDLFISARTPASARQSGTGPRLGASGTGATQSVARVGLNGGASRRTVQTAAFALKRWFESLATLKPIARRRVRRWRTDSAVSKASTPLLIERVRPLNETADVWDITVPDGHWFSLANGAVVHNSDAFGLMCVAYQEPRQKREREPVAAGGWMGR